MKLSTIDVRDVIADIMLDNGFDPSDIALFERKTQPIVGLMGRPLNDNLSWGEIRDLIVKLCAPEDGYGEDPSITNGGLMNYGYSYANMVQVMIVAEDELKTMFNN